MRKIENILFVILYFIVLISCEKEIDPDIDTDQPQLVIEAQLKQGVNDFTVTVTKSSPYFETANQEKVSSASIRLEDDLGNSNVIPHVFDGEYKAEIDGVPGVVYRLIVEVDGEVYSAESKMLEKIELVSLETEFQSGTFSDDDGFEITFRYVDPGEEQNFYRVTYAINGEPQLSGKNLQVISDDFNDGQLTKIPVLAELFEDGEKVTVELIHFDKTAFEYFNSLADIVSDANGFGGSAAPSNPNTNWSPEVLGHFTAVNSDTMSIVVR